MGGEEKLNEGGGGGKRRRRNMITFIREMARRLAKEERVLFFLGG